MAEKEVISDMGFLSAVRDISLMERKSGIEQQLKFPMENKNGGIIRVFLDVDDLNAKQLCINGVKKVDVIDYRTEPEMKVKYLWRERVGSNAFWGFSPIYKAGKPLADVQKRKESFLGKNGDWLADKDCHLYKIRLRILNDYEKEGFFSSGSVDRIMRDLPNKINEQLESLDKRKSYIVVFGIATVGDDEFLYPGEVPCFVSYFEHKLSKEVFGLGDTESKGSASDEKRCALCGKRGKTTTLDKIFKFSTFDKVSILPGLSELEATQVFPICLDCQAKLSAGREYIERNLTNVSAIGGIRIWAVPEQLGNDSGKFRQLVRNLIENFKRDAIGTPGEKTEEKYFHRLARDGQGLIFHFLFWEKNNSQELVHFMVEDVPPERLAFLETAWKEAASVTNSKLVDGSNLDSCIRSLYRTLYSIAGKSEVERSVLRDFVLEIVGHLLSGTKAPVKAFKQIIVSRVPGFMHQNENWSEVVTVLNYALALVEFMNIVNEGLL